MSDDTRQVALSFAIQASPQATPEDIIKAAIKFQAFLEPRSVAMKKVIDDIATAVNAFQPADDPVRCLEKIKSRVNEI